MLRYMTAVALGGLFLFTTAGCLITGGKSIEESGVQITSRTLNQITLGETSEAWLVATLGEPSDRTAVKDQPNTAVLKYEHVVCRAEGATVFLLFAGGSDSKKVTTTYFESVDGVITRYWIER